MISNVKKKLLGTVAVAVFASLGLSSAQAFEKAQTIGAVESTRAVEFNIYLPLQNRAGLNKLLEDLHTPGSALFHKWLKPEEFKARFGASPAAIAQITKELTAAGLKVTETHVNSLRVRGAATDVERAFSTKLMTAKFSSGAKTLKAAAPMTLTPAMSANGAMVSAFSGVVRMHPMARTLGKVIPQNRKSALGGYWFTDLKQAYGYPSYKTVSGKGAHIGILMTGGYNPADMNAYFSHEKLATPAINEVDIFGGAPYAPDFGVSGETHLDIQQSGGMAPNATVTLYNIPDLYDDSIIAGITDIVEFNSVDVVNMSFGGAELGYRPAYNGGVDYSGILTVYDDLFAQGNAEGITFVASSGDEGAKSIPEAGCFSGGTCAQFVASTEFPAASPHVTGVGGTNLVTTTDPSHPADLNSYLVSENAYPDPLVGDPLYGTTASGAYWGSGGGISQFYAKPSYQYLVTRRSTSFRTVPDLSLHMGGCPGIAVQPCGPNRSYDLEALGGVYYGVIGTSASSPDFAGLVALKIEYTGGRLGNENYDIYSLAAAQNAGSSRKVFRGTPSGSDGLYYTYPGYNLVTGNGTLYANNFVAPNLPTAGMPQTSTNP